MTAQLLQKTNGIDIAKVQALVGAVSEDTTQGKAKFQVATTWEGGTRSTTRINSWQLGNQILPRNFTIAIDEPAELGGDDRAPNPQEILLAGLNACVLTTYVALSALQGIDLESVTIATEGELDLRGFFKLDNRIHPGYQNLHYTLTVKAKNATPEQLEALHQAVQEVSPNFWNITHAVKLDTTFVVA